MSQKWKDWPISAANIKALEDPAFLEHLKSQTGGIIRPDPEDIDRSVPAGTIEEQAEQYRLAQTRKMLRLYLAWKAVQDGPYRP
jgi:hypothetical protein